MSNDKKVRFITIPQMGRLPKWMVWAAYGAIIAVTWSFCIQPQAWLVYVLAGAALGLVYLASGLYQGMAYCFNKMNMKETTGHGTIEELLEKVKNLDGTKPDETCLTKGQEENKDEPKS